jgi:hypothetical protein
LPAPTRISSARPRLVPRAARPTWACSTYPSCWLTSGSRATPEPPRAPRQLHHLGPRSPRAEPPAAMRSLRRRSASLRSHASSLTRTRAELPSLQRPAPGPRVRALRPRGPLAARVGPAPRASMPLVKPRATARGSPPRPSHPRARHLPLLRQPRARAPAPARTPTCVGRSPPAPRPTHRAARARSNPELLCRQCAWVVRPLARARPAWPGRLAALAPAAAAAASRPSPR